MSRLFRPSQQLLTALLLAFSGREAVATAEVPPSDAGEVSAPRPSPHPAPALQSLELPSGLKVVLETTPGARELTACTAIRAGTSHDPKEAPGATRVLAEMLKETGYQVPGQDYASVLHERGARSEYKIGRDQVTFCTTLPATELALALWVAEGRFSESALLPEAFEQKLAAVADQALAYQEDIAGSQARQRLSYLAYLGAPAENSAEMPGPEALEGMDLTALRRLHRSLYTAGRAVLAISGGFSDAGIRPLLEQYLARVPSTASRKPVDDSVRPIGRGQTTERYSMLQDPSSKVPAVWYGFRAPSGDAGDALRIGLRILTSTERLGKQLTGPGGPATDYRLELDSPGPGAMARIFAVGRASHSPELIENRLDAAIKELQQAVPSSEEVEAAVRAEQEERSRALGATTGRALELAQGVLRGRSPSQILEDGSVSMDRPRPTPEAVRQAILGHLGRNSRSVVELYPKGWKDPWQAPMPSYHIVSSGETLSSIAKRHGLTVAALAKLNKLNQTRPIFPGDKLKVPAGKPKPKLRTHTVRRGDTLLGLGRVYQVTAADIAEQNGLSTKQAIRIGQVLEIPPKNSSKPESRSQPGSGKNQPGTGSSSDSESGPGIHVVKRGETLGGIAAHHGVSLLALAKQNRLSSQAKVTVGQKLVIPAAPKPATPPTGTSPSKPTGKLGDKAAPATGAAGNAGKASGKSSESQATPTAPKEPRVHIVRAGETLSEIAHKNGLGTRILAQANRLSEKAPLRVGQRLVIPEKQ